MKLFKKIGVIACSALVVIALAGCATDTYSTQEQQQQQQQSISLQAQADTVSVSSQAQVNVAENYIGEAQAKAIALAHAGVDESEVSHMFCKLDYDDGVAEYEVEFWDGTTEYDYEIHAISGEIIGYDYDMESHNATPPTSATPGASASAEYIGEVQAKAIALAHAGIAESEAGNIRCELDYDDGIAEYEVEWRIGTVEYNYTISAVDGTIWEHEIEYED